MIDGDECKDQHGFTLEEYLENRDCFSEVGREIANDIEKVVKGTAIARTTGGAVGIFSGVVGIIGLCLIPVTLGASAGLTIAAAVTGTGSGITSSS